MPGTLPAMEKDRPGSGSKIVDARETFSTLLEMSK